MKMILRLTLLLVFLDLSPPTVTAQRVETVKRDQVGVIDWEELEYPGVARLAHIEGIVVVQARLDDGGNVVQSTALWGNKAFIPACLANAKKWRFRGDSHSDVVIVYNFRMNDGVCHPKSTRTHFTLLPPNFATISTCVESIQ